jgi:hypothetical protein
MPARGMNMFLEKQLKEGNVDINLDAKSIIGLLDEDERSAEHKYMNGIEVYDEYEKGNFYRPKPMRLREEEAKESGPAIKSNDVEEFRQLLKALKESKE